MKADFKFEAESKAFDAQFKQGSQAFTADFGQVQTVTEYVGGELYEGEYEVTPQFDEQTLPTKEKVMAADVTIKAIPVYRVSNTSGGITVYIANEV